MPHNQTESEFLQDVSKHQMEVVRADSHDRHLRFRRPNGSSTFFFEIITTHNLLVISGDMGDYTFRRLPDMFNFFRMSDNDFNKRGIIPINPSYWAEKMHHHSSYNQDHLEFSPEHAQKFLEEDLQENYEWEEYQIQVLIGELDFENEFTFFNSLANLDLEYEFSELEDKYKEFDISSFISEISPYNYLVTTYHYIWCLRAIVWAIQQFDKWETDQK